MLGGARLCTCSALVAPEHASALCTLRQAAAIASACKAPRKLVRACTHKSENRRPGNRPVAGFSVEYLMMWRMHEATCTRWRANCTKSAHRCIAMHIMSALRAAWTVQISRRDAAFDCSEQVLGSKGGRRSSGGLYESPRPLGTPVSHRRAVHASRVIRYQAQHCSRRS